MTAATTMPDAPMMAAFLMLCFLSTGAVVAGVIALVIWLFRRKRP